MIFKTNQPAAAESRLPGANFINQIRKLVTARLLT